MRLGKEKKGGSPCHNQSGKRSDANSMNERNCLSSRFSKRGKASSPRDTQQAGRQTDRDPVFVSLFVLCFSFPSLPSLPLSPCSFLWLFPFSFPCFVSLFVSLFVSFVVLPACRLVCLFAVTEADPSYKQTVTEASSHGTWPQLRQLGPVTEADPSYGR